MVSCKEYAEKRKTELKEAPTHMELSIVQVGDDAGAAAYVRGKIKDCTEIGIKTYLYEAPADITQDEFANTITTAALNGGGLMITLPLPPQLHIRKEWFQPIQDVDGLCYDLYPSCTAEGIVDWLKYNEVDFEKSNIVLLGRGKLVGRPLSQMLIDEGATVTVCNSHTPKEWVDDFIDKADIVISATGQHINISPFIDYNKKRLWIDVGVHFENGQMCGDLPYDWLIAGGQEITPVPGGVGLLTRVTLLKHLTTLYS